MKEVDIMSERICAVTGGKGFVGYALVKELHSLGDKIKLLLRSDTPIFDGMNCEKIFGDLCNSDDLEKTFEGAEVVFHIAGLVDISGKKTDKLWMVNFEGTKNVVEACKKCGVKKLVYVSSVDAIPVPGETEEIVEISHFDPDLIEGDYGKTKAAASQYILDSADESLDVFVVHPSTCIGPDDFNETSSVLSMIKLYNKGVFSFDFDFGATNFIDIRDVAKGMIAAAEKGRSGECYILSGHRLTLSEFMHTLSKIRNKKPPRITIKKDYIEKILPSIENIFEMANIPPVLNEYSLRKLSENCNFSNEKARKELGFIPRPFEATLIDTIEWIKHRD